MTEVWTGIFVVALDLLPLFSSTRALCGNVVDTNGRAGRTAETHICGTHKCSSHYGD